MAYDPAKAALFNKLRQDGLSEDAAYDQAGIKGNDVYNYTANEVGSPDPKAANYNPNYGQLEKAGFANATAKSSKLTPAEEEADPDVEEQVTKTKTTPVASTTTTTTSETVSGGGTRTVITQPSQKVDSAVTQDLQNKADAIAAERNELSAQLKAEGLTQAQVRSDPRYKELNTKYVDAQNAADSSTLGVPGTGSTTITTTPNTTATTTTVETSSPSYLTKNAGASDPTVQDQQISQTTAQVPASQVQSSPTDLASDPNTNLGAAGQEDQPPTEAAFDVTEEDPEAANLREQAQEIERAQLAATYGAEQVGDADPLATAAAEAAAANADLAGEPPTESAVDVEPTDPEVAALLEQQQFINREILAQEATDVEPGPDSGYPTVPPLSAAEQAGTAVSDGSEAGVAAEVGRLNAQQQKTLQARQNRPSQGDWRVRIHLAPGSNYLYNAPAGKVNGVDLPGPGILAPLTATDGVIFPYTPSIETSYQAKYQTTDLVHSNYRGYFYQGSYVDSVTVRGTFTAQDTREAQYLLAVIHFFRSATKMFYGQDQQAGTPPPLVYLTGLGQYQFNKHPCVISNFTYSLPNDVDYIRADGFNNYGINLENRRTLSSGPSQGGFLGFLANKLGANGLFPGGLKQVPTQGAVTASITNTTNTNSTYVPTKMEISVQMYPIQTRAQVSQQFSLQAFANGNLLKGGFW
jgi:hypothetical protein